MNANRTPLILATLAVLTFTAGASAQATPLPIAQSPLFVAAQVPPLNMLVVGKDHKNYYEAYNDASDLNGDGALDIGYKPSLEYFGYFNSFACYLWSAGQNRFEPVAAAPGKTCGGAGQWSGDFLNYLTTSRMDALRRVLYGGWRHQDTAADTTLQGAFFPQDAHSWGKEYQSIARDGYDIRQYAPLPLPSAGNYHLFAVTTVADNTAPLFRVLQNTSFRVWNWLSIEGPVANNRCFTASNSAVNCLSGGGGGAWATVPAAALSNVQITTWRWDSPGGLPTARGNAAELGTFFTDFATTARQCGSGAVGSGQIDTSGSNNNPFTGPSRNNCTHDNYLTEITATLTVSDSGSYRFAVNGDDSVEVSVNGAVTAGRYGNGGAHDRSDASWNALAGTVNLSAGTHTIRFRHVEAGGGDNWSLAWQPPGAAPAATTRQDYSVRVQACPANVALQDVYCKAYPSGGFKPTGILHDYGETGRMKFGLITGSQRNNLEGGVLRRNVLPFASEIDANTGQFLAGANGIVRNLDGLRMIGGSYGGGVTNNLASDANWQWGGGFGNCPSFGERSLENRECRMWGNPVAEMLYESMRYYAGATVPTNRFAIAPATSPGMLEEAAMGLTTETWRNPYADTAVGGLGYLSCAKPYQTIISDINPSYDGDLPGSPFTGAVTAVNDTPPSVSSFNAATQGQTIWSHEFGAGNQSVFVGQVGNAASDGAPTAKSASSLGNIRGLSPEEPTKEGTFFSASVAHFGRTRDVSAAAGDQRLSTFSIALASPLPRIEFPVNGRLVTILPFGKTVSGTFGGGIRKPTNTIVDFYVEEIANLPGAPTNVARNGGRPYAAFRINYEDVEQGNDHDMDAIVRYEALANVGGTVTVNLSSEYAAGSADQNIGYVISGTTADGVYLEVRDRDGPGTPYLLNTPPGAGATDCSAPGALLTAPCNQALQLTSSRTFTPAPVGAVATALQLKDPLWFAAKYGGFKEPVAGGNNLPDGTEWDANGDGTPDNYFLVTNPLQLRQQLSNAFDQILGEERPAGIPATTGSRLIPGSLQFVPQYRVDGSERDWTGDVKALRINADGTPGTEVWSAAARLTAVAPAARRIFTASFTGDASTRVVVPFQPSEFGATPALQLGALGLTPGAVSARYGPAVNADDLFGYLRGVRTLEQSQPGGVFRNRSALLGSIINSQPQPSQKRDVFRWISQPELRADYQTFITSKRASARPDVVYVGSNEGMLHGFNTVNGNEVFAYVPASARVEMGRLPDPVFTHRFLVDGDINVADARVGGAWRSVLLGSTGRGGRTLFALDVTAPQSFAASNVLWELAGGTGPGQDADVGIQLGRAQVMYGEDEGWYAVFANGINSENGNPVLMIVNLQTGVVTRRLEANDAGVHANGLTNIAMVDADGNGRIDSVYGGDLRGHVWKFDLSATSPSGWGVAFSGSPLFTATDTAGAFQPITGGIDVARGAGGLMVYFGTGRYLAPQDASPGTTPQVQSLYAVLDRGAGGIQRSNLVAQQITGQLPGTVASRETTRNPVNFNTGRGWYLDLAVAGAAAGEMFFGEPEVRSGLVLFFSFEVTGDACAPGGKSWAYGLDAITGGALLGGTASVTGGMVGTTENTGAVAAGTGAPVRGAVFVQPSPPCRPGIDPGCPVAIGPGGLPVPTPAGAQTRCGEVEVNTGALFERACGRQSWRQVR